MSTSLSVAWIDTLWSEFRSIDSCQRSTGVFFDIEISRLKHKNYWTVSDSSTYYYIFAQFKFISVRCQHFSWESFPCGVLSSIDCIEEIEYKVHSILDLVFFYSLHSFTDIHTNCTCSTQSINGWNRHSASIDINKHEQKEHFPLAVSAYVTTLNKG